MHVEMDIAFGHFHLHLYPDQGQWLSSLYELTKHILLNEQCHFSPHLGQNINACAYPSQVPWSPLFIMVLKTADYTA
jgi:hypothetical protein